MASKEEDNKLECKSNVNKGQERNFVNVYKKYEYILNSKVDSFEKKVESIVEVWKSVGELNLAESDIRYVIQIMDWAKLHALNIVLTAEWKDHKAKYELNLLQEIEKAQNELLKINSAFSTRCKKLADVVRNPWEDPILERLLASKDATIGPEEIEFFCVETAYLVSVRLKKLCESQCEDLALNLVTAFMNCNKLSKTQNFNLNATETQMWFIFDIYIALLYKFQENQKIVALLKELSLEEGLQLIRRFAKKRVKISKIWKHCHRIAVLASQVFVSTAAVKFSEEHRQILENLVDCFISICTTDSLMENFTNSLRRISQLADASGLYIFCDVVHRKAGQKLKPFTIEMYVRALTADMNNLERQKNDNETEKVAETTKRLATAFCKLADLLDEHVKVSRECVLTAFSLEPTQERMKRIEELASRSGFQVLDTGQDWKCKLHPPVLPSDDIAWTCTACGEWMCKPQLNVPLNTNTALNEALTTGDLGISPQLCDDLVVCLSNPRYQVLSWLLAWEDLHRLCVMYLNDPERTKNIVTELKFVDIDYSIFKGIKQEPVDELAGIERGYEQYLDHDFTSDDQLSTLSEDSASQDSRPYSLGSDGAGDPYQMLLSQPKSDPNTLKSLRMFRPNLKRSRTIEPGCSIPEKLYKANKMNHIQSNGVEPTAIVNHPTANNCYMGSSMHFRDMNLLNYSTPPLNNRNNIGNNNSASFNLLPSDLTVKALHNNLNYDLPSVYKQDSKNGLVATLSPPGGQVAVKQMKQTNSNNQLPKNSQPTEHNPVKVTISEATKQGIMRSLQNKLLRSGFQGNNKKEQPCLKNLSKQIDHKTHSSRLQDHLKVKNPSQTNSQVAQDSLEDSCCKPNPKDSKNRTNQQPKPNGSCPKEKKAQLSNKEVSISIQDLSKTQCSQPSKVELQPLKVNPAPCKVEIQPSKTEFNSCSKEIENPKSNNSLKKESLSNSMNNCSFNNMNNMSKDSSSCNRQTVINEQNTKKDQNLQQQHKIPTVDSVSKGNNSLNFSIKVKSITSKTPLDCQSKTNSEAKPFNNNNRDCKTFSSTCKPNIKGEHQKQAKENVIKPRITNECNKSNGISVQDLIDKTMRNLCTEQNKIKSSKNSEISWTKDKQTLLKQLLINDDVKSKNLSDKGKLNCDDVKKNHGVAHEKSVLTVKNETIDEKGGKPVNKDVGDKKYTNEVPKNLNLTEQSRIYDKKSDVSVSVENKDCVKMPSHNDSILLNNCKNVNISNKLSLIEKLSKTHSPLVRNGSHIDNINSLISKKSNGKELKVVLCRISSSDKYALICTTEDDNFHGARFQINNYNLDNKIKCDKGLMPLKNGRRRKSNNMDKSENNLNEQAPKRVQNYKLSPLLDINPRVPSAQKDDISDSKVNIVCDDLCKKSKKPESDNLNPQVMLERLPSGDRSYVRSILANIPGLNDYQMVRPSNVNQIVNVVQIQGGRPTSTVPVQNTQTSTQVSPHIQRIGQPRIEKPEQTPTSESSTTTTSTVASTTTTTVKPTTSQPSTLINILSQQIIRPGQSNCVRTRSSPLINLLSQQIIRPATTSSQKTTTNSNSVTSTDSQTNSTPPKPVTTTTEQSVVSPTSTATTTVKSTATSAGQGTILQFICKSSLPKFQQAFGKTAYQNNTESTEVATSTAENTATDTNKKPVTTKNIPVNVQPIQGGVIYTRQVPVGQTINLIPPGRGQVFRIATSNPDQISLVKDTVIHSKMSALLAAALQGKQKTSDTPAQTESSSDDTSGTRVAVARPTLVQNARIVKPLLQIPSNVIRSTPQSNLSSTTLEQLREFDMVYKQIKERSSTSTPADANTQPESIEPTSQRISVTYVNQGQKYTQLSPVVVVSNYCNLQPAASPALSVTSQGSSSPCVTPAPTPTIVPKIATKSSKGKTLKSTTTHTSKASPIPKPQQKPQEDEHTTQRIFDILAEYAEQLRNSPDLNNKPAPRRRSNPPTNPSQNSKRKKSSGSKKSGQCSNMSSSEIDTEDQRTMGSEDSSCGVVQLPVQDEEQQTVPTTEASEPTTTTSNSRQLILTDSTGSQTRNLIIADSSVGEALKMPNTAVLVPGNYIMPVSMVKGGQQIAVVSGGSKILATVPARSGPNMLLFQSFLNQNRKTGVPTVKYSAIQPLSGISSQSRPGISAQPPVILSPNSQQVTAVTLGQPLTIKKIDETDCVNTELLLTISQPRDNAKIENDITPNSSANVNIKLEDSRVGTENSPEKVFQTYQKNLITTPIATSVIAQTSSVKDENVQDNSISQNIITMSIAPDNLKEDTKSGDRVQSVLVTACTSNGPMLSHTPPRYRKPSDSTISNHEITTKEEYLHNGESQNNNEQKHFQSSTVYYANKTKKPVPQRLDRELHQLTLQRKQAALERELRLQKSLSEECEDLGVDEPSTSDLFPEADLLFDSNHSPSFDQSSQDLLKRAPHAEIKDENKSTITLFSDDDNSSSLRTDIFEFVEYRTAENVLEYGQTQQITNGQSSTSNESGSSCEDNTLLQNCASMSDVTLNSPISPDLYTDNTPSSLNKYKFKYSNRKKGERNKQTESWTGEVSSSEDTTGSTELGKSGSHSPEPCSNKRSHSISCDEEFSDGSYRVVRVAMSKTDLLKGEESCDELHCDEDSDSPSGRGARRSVRKLCSCCNGSQEGGVSRKRPTSRPHTPSPHKKAFLNKKR